MAPTINAWMYEKYITRVKDVYGHFYYVATRHLHNPDKIMLAICTHRGLKRTHTQAGRDGMNVLHRDNIAEVRETKLSFHFEVDDPDPHGKPTVKLICQKCGMTYTHPRDEHDPETGTWPTVCPDCTAPSYPMVAGEGAPQYTFELPDQPVQLALL